MSPRPLRVVVAEDEPLARERLVRLLRQAGCEVLAELTDGPGLLSWLRQGQPADALLVDVQMPGATAFEALAELEPGIPLPPLVFVSAFQDHAVRAFDVKALDYLLKPVSPERLEQTLQRLREPRLATKDSRESDHQHRFPAKAGDGHVILDLRKVTHFEVSSMVVWVWVRGQRFRTNWRSLAEVEGAFPRSRFIRIQRHLLLRPEAVTAVRGLSGGRASVKVMDGGDLEVSRDSFRALKDILGL